MDEVGMESPVPIGGSDPTLIRLSPQAEQAVKAIMDLGNMKTMDEAIRRAIGDALFLLRQRQEGWKVLLRKDGRYREVLWPELPDPEHGKKVDGEREENRNG